MCTSCVHYHYNGCVTQIVPFTLLLLTWNYIPWHITFPSRRNFLQMRHCTLGCTQTYMHLTSKTNMRWKKQNSTLLSNLLNLHIPRCFFFRPRPLLVQSLHLHLLSLLIQSLLLPHTSPPSRGLTGWVESVQGCNLLTPFLSTSSPSILSEKHKYQFPIASVWWRQQLRRDYITAENNICFCSVSLCTCVYVCVYLWICECVCVWVYMSQVVYDMKLEKTW